MAYLTDRKRAEGLGAGGSGAQQHWKMIASSILLTILVPLFVCTFGGLIGEDLVEVTATLGRPVPFIIVALTLVVGINHFKMEADEAIEDYVGGIKRKLTLIAVSAFSYTLIALGLFALLKIAL